MKDFIYHSPTKIYFGDYVEQVGSIIKEKGFKNVLFHYGQNSIHKTGLYERVVASLKKAELNVVELGKVEANPKIDLVRTGVKLAKENKIDFVLAVGGGSVIDSAKLIGCAAMVDFDPWLFSNHEKVPQCTLPVGVILTISAAGSELSNSCVITNSALKIKNGFNSEVIRPVFAIMDPKLTCTVSKYQTACGIVDIMMHTMERYFVDDASLDFTDSIAIGLLKSVMKAGNAVMMNPNDIHARATLMIASSFSHNGLTGMGSTMHFTVHKLEHILSGTYDKIAHGAGLAVLFPAWAKWIYPHLKDKFTTFAKEVMEIEEEDVNLKIEKAIDALKGFYHKIGMPTSFTELGLTDKQIEELVKLATNNYQITIPGFIALDANKIREIFQLAK